ncbi:uncharacterized protein [Linepithema humile]|uniref:uncharacterized protein isoform X1 n=1 Tax=Linepithema humile TaxID=83485 RepID=UPI00351EE088
MSDNRNINNIIKNDSDWEEFLRDFELKLDTLLSESYMRQLCNLKSKALTTDYVETDFSDSDCTIYYFNDTQRWFKGETSNYYNTIIEKGKDFVFPVGVPLVPNERIILMVKKKVDEWTNGHVMLEEEVTALRKAISQDYDKLRSKLCLELELTGSDSDKESESSDSDSEFESSDSDNESESSDSNNESEFSDSSNECVKIE